MKILGIDPGLVQTGFGIISIKNNNQTKLIDYGIKEGEFTKEDLYLNVSSSGVATVIVKSLIQKGIFVEHKFNCNHCKFYTIDKTKINIE